MNKSIFGKVLNIKGLDTKALIYELGLKALYTYTLAKTKAEIDSIDGIRLIGSSQVDSEGVYKITIEEQQHISVIAYALDADEKIIGISNVVRIKDYGAKSDITGPDIIIPMKAQSTFDKLYTKVSTYVQKSDMSISDLSQDQVEFISSQIELEKELIESLVNCFKFYNTDDIKLVPLLFALQRKGIPLEWSTLAFFPESQLLTAIKEAISDNFIGPFDDAEINQCIKKMLDKATCELLSNPQGKKATNLVQSLKLATSDLNTQIEYINTFRGMDTKAHSVRGNISSENAQHNEFVKNLKWVEQLGELTDHQYDIVELLIKEKNVTDVSSLLKTLSEDWGPESKSSDARGSVSFKSTDEIVAIKKKLSASIYTTYPNQAINHMVQQGRIRFGENPIRSHKASMRESITPQESIAEGITTVLNADKFDIRFSRVEDFSNKLITNKDVREKVDTHLNRIKRLYQVAPHNDTILESLLNKNYHSSRQIAQRPRQTFLKENSVDLGGEIAALEVHERATANSWYADQLFLIANDIVHGVLPHGISGASRSDFTNAVRKVLPNYSELFEGLQINEIDEETSVYSPASYLVDVLHFLQGNPQRILFSRRPDIAALPLTAENTTTTIPYIDLCNEIMEYYVVNKKIDSFAGYDTGDLTSLELHAAPQNTLKSAYLALSQSIYPLELFHQPFESMRLSYEQLGTSRLELLEVLNETVDKPVYDEAIGLAPQERAILTDNTYNFNDDVKFKLHEYFGYSKDDKKTFKEEIYKVPALLQRTGIAYKELVAIINTQFINPNRSLYDFIDRIFSPTVINVAFKSPKYGQRLILGKNALTAKVKAVNGVIQGLEFYKENSFIGAASLDDTGESGTIYHNFIDTLNFSLTIRAITLNHEENSSPLQIMVIPKPPNAPSVALPPSTSTNATQPANLNPDPSPSDIYKELEKIKNDGTRYVYNKYMQDHLLGNKIKIKKDSPEDITFTDWTLQNFQHIESIISLYNSNSDLDLKITELRSLKDSKSNSAPDVSSPAYCELFSKINRFIRLWKKLDCSIEELDLLIFCLGETDITESLIEKLYYYQILKSMISIPLNKLGCLWGRFDTFGANSLYNQLFLNNARIVNKAFEPTQLNQLLPKDPANHIQWPVPLKEKTKDLEHQDPTIKVLEAFRISSNELKIILDDLDIKVEDATQALPLDLTNLSKIYAYPILADALGITVENVCDLKNLFNMSPFQSIKQTCEFVKLVKNIQATKFDTETLKYIIDDKFKSNLALPDVSIQQAFTTFREGLLAIEKEHPESDSVSITEDLLRSKMLLIYNRPIVERFFEIMQGEIKGIVEKIDPLLINTLRFKYATFSYSVSNNGAYGVLSIKGILTKTEKDEAIRHFEGKPECIDIIGKAYNNSNEFFTAYFNNLSLNEGNDYLKFLDNTVTPTDPLFVIRQSFYSHFLPFLKDKLRQNLWIQCVSNTIGLEIEIAQALLAPSLERDVGSFAKMGFTPEKLSDSMAQFNMKIECLLFPNSNQRYAFSVKNGTVPFTDLNFYLDGTTALAQDLMAGRSYALRIEYKESSADPQKVSIFWKTDTSLEESIDTQFLVPYSVYALFSDTLRQLHKTFLFIKSFNLTIEEVKYYNIATARGEHLSGLSMINARHFLKILTFLIAKNLVTSAPDLIGVLKMKDIAPNDTDVKTKIDQILLSTNWKRDDVENLLNHFGSEKRIDFSDEKILLRWAKAITLFQKIGSPSDEILQWSIQDDYNDFNFQFYYSQSLKNAVIAKYHTSDIPNQLSNKLREKQRDALIDYLLSHPELIEWDVSDADDLFEFFLIDVKMGSKMDTSRVKQAISSVQLFVNRCLLNLESRKDNTGREIGVAPNDIDTEIWDWMKNYRVWEANRKIFLYPENLLDPELRDDKSPFFKELESELLQNDITQSTVKSAYFNYLEKLDSISNLEICGLCEDKKQNTIHIFARTNNLPYEYYYMAFYCQKESFSAWQKIDVSIRSVDDASEKGVHLMPVVWNSRLFLFWPEYNKQNIPRTICDTNGIAIPASQLADLDPKHLEADTYWDVSLAWTEMADGKWSKRNGISKVFKLEGATSDVSIPDTTNLKYKYSKLAPLDLNTIKILVSINDVDSSLGFQFFNSRGLLKAVSIKNLRNPIIGSSSAVLSCDKNYIISYQNLLMKDSNQLVLDSTTYLYKKINQQLLLSIDNGQPKATSPILFKDLNTSRSYLLKYQDKDKKIRFITFFHPFANSLKDSYNITGPKGGINGLVTLNLNTEENLKDFTKDYAPDNNVVDTTYAGSNFSFSPGFPYSVYNWELFYHIPLFIAVRLSKNGKFEEAQHWFHYIFNPTTNDAPNSSNPSKRYWQVKYFRDLDISQSLQKLFSSADVNNAIAHWRSNPFNSFLVARDRPVAFMKNVVMRYIDNLIAWGDELYRQDTIESINKATQLYIIASHILGPQPQVVPPRGKRRAQSYGSLKPKLDAFSNALVDLENYFPYSSNYQVGSDTTLPISLLGIGHVLYFSIPNNDQLLQYWNTVGDRLFNIRYSRNIAGIERSLALFEPAIDPALLAKAKARGLSMGSILADLNSPSPLYRFNVLLQKAKEYCQEVKTLGNAILAALEKKDTEMLSLLRTKHEKMSLTMTTKVKEEQLREALATIDHLKKQRENTVARAKYYLGLIGITAEIPEYKTGEDTKISEVSFIAAELVESDEEHGIKLIKREKEDIDKSNDAHDAHMVSSTLEALAGIAHALPTASLDGKPLGVGGGLSWGGMNIGNMLNASAQVAQIFSTKYSHEATRASKMAGYVRRQQDWTQQANTALREILPIDKQLIAAEIRVQILQKELENHLQQITFVDEINDFMLNKFTNQELYTWFKEKLFGIYKQNYQMAYDTAKRAEKALQFELGQAATSFIQYGYFDSTYDGLTAGEQLHFAINFMEKFYVEQNRRELELTKHISLALFRPDLLMQIKQTGKCEIDMPEELFDLDYPGHYFRRIKSVSISIPCVTGPYSTVNSSLRLVKNTIRLNTSIVPEYQFNNDQRFTSNYTPCTSMATSSGQNDSGQFELNFRDERYLPFEGAGAISTWNFELNGKYGENDISQFNFDTISDIIIHLKYTAREDNGIFKKKAIENLISYLKEKGPLLRLFNVRQEFGNQWDRLKQLKDGVLELNVDKRHLPFFVHNYTIVLTRIEILADTTLENLRVEKYTNCQDSFTGIGFTRNDNYGDLKYCPLDIQTFELKSDETFSVVLSPKDKIDSNIQNLYILITYKIKQD
jgi:hypothetical protein